MGIERHLHAAKLWLSTEIHPSAFYVLLAIVVGLFVFASRRALPQVWARLERENKILSKVVQGAPAVAVSAIVAVGAGGESADYALAFWGAVSGIGAALGHHVLKWLPVPYKGEPAPLDAPPSERDGFNGGDV